MTFEEKVVDAAEVMRITIDGAVKTWNTFDPEVQGELKRLSERQGGLDMHDYLAYLWLTSGDLSRRVREEHGNAAEKL